MDIVIYGLAADVFHDVCDNLGNDWYTDVVHHEDYEQCNVVIDTEVVSLKANNGIWLHKGAKIALIGTDDYEKIEIM